MGAIEHTEWDFCSFWTNPLGGGGTAACFGLSTLDLIGAHMSRCLNKSRNSGCCSLFKDSFLMPDSMFVANFF